MADVSPAEALARFILSHRHFSREGDRVRAEAFIPLPYAELSVFRIDALTELDIWNLGEAVAGPQQKTLYGRAHVLAGSVMKIGLPVLPDEPPPRHAVITGWPRDDKARQKLLALQIAAASRLVRRE